MDPGLLLLMWIILFAYLIGAATGFGSAIIALTLAVNLFPIDYLIPVIIPLNAGQSAGSTLLPINSGMNFAYVE